jgi:hypothetical protein
MLLPNKGVKEYRPLVNSIAHRKQHQQHPTKSGEIVCDFWP